MGNAKKGKPMAMCVRGAIQQTSVDSSGVDWRYNGVFSTAHPDPAAGETEATSLETVFNRRGNKSLDSFHRPQIAATKTKKEKNSTAMPAVVVYQSVDKAAKVRQNPPLTSTSASNSASRSVGMRDIDARTC